MADGDNRQQHATSKKAKICGAIEYLEAQNIPHFKSRVFDHFKVSHRQGWAMISEGSEERRHYGSESEERRGRPRKISNWHLKEIDRIIREEGFEARKISWNELAFEVGLEGSDSRTIARAMGNSMKCSKCIACQKKWCNESTAKARSGVNSWLGSTLPQKTGITFAFQMKYTGLLDPKDQSILSGNLEKEVPSIIHPTADYGLLARWNGSAHLSSQMVKANKMV